MIIRDITPSHITHARIVELSGEVDRGDFVQFANAIEGIDHALIFVSGPGGDLEEALEIGAEIRARNYSTAVSLQQCASACAYIWLSGALRYKPAESQIDFHAASAVRDDHTAMAIADLASFLTYLGLKREAIRYFTSAPAYDVRSFGLEDAVRLSVDVTVLKLDEGLIPPLPSRAEPSSNPGEIARLASILVVFYGQCGSHHNANDDAVKAFHKDLMDRGQQAVGEKVFFEMLSVELLRRVYEVQAETREHWCRRIRMALEKTPLKDILEL